MTKQRMTAKDLTGIYYLKTFYNGDRWCVVTVNSEQEVIDVRLANDPVHAQEIVEHTMGTSPWFRGKKLNSNDVCYIINWGESKRFGHIAKVI